MGKWGAMGKVVEERVCGGRCVVPSGWTCAATARAMRTLSLCARSASAGARLAGKLVG